MAGLPRGGGGGRGQGSGGHVGVGAGGMQRLRVQSTVGGRSVLMSWDCVEPGSMLAVLLAAFLAAHGRLDQAPQRMALPRKQRCTGFQ